MPPSYQGILVIIVFPFDYRYRIGAYVADNSVELLRVGHREDFYKYFPPA
jgi:mRNA-degrading endonuclease RelE of RelBE toxin-antitoxin system